MLRSTFVGFSVLVVCFGLCCFIFSFISLPGDAEEGEIDTSVGTVFQKIGPLGEIIVFSMLQHEDGVLVYEAAVHDAVGEFTQFG